MCIITLLAYRCGHSEIPPNAVQPCTRRLVLPYTACPNIQDASTRIPHACDSCLHAFPNLLAGYQRYADQISTILESIPIRQRTVAVEREMAVMRERAAGEVRWVRDQLETREGLLIRIQEGAEYVAGLEAVVQMVEVRLAGLVGTLATKDAYAELAWLRVYVATMRPSR